MKELLLNTDSAHVNFFGYNLEGLQRRHVMRNKNSTTLFDFKNGCIVLIKHHSVTKRPVPAVTRTVTDN